MADRWERVMDLVEIEWEIDDVSGEPREVDLMVLADCWGADPDVGLGPSLSIEWAKINGDGPDLSLSMSNSELDALRRAVWAKLERGPEY